MGVRFISGEPGLRAEGLACAMSEATPSRLRAHVEDARTELVEASLLSGVAFYSQGIASSSVPTGVGTTPRNAVMRVCELKRWLAWWREATPNLHVAHVEDARIGNCRSVSVIQGWDFIGRGLLRR